MIQVCQKCEMICGWIIYNVSSLAQAKHIPVMGMAAVVKVSTTSTARVQKLV